jgi:serine/threonine protein kinase
MKTMRVGTSIYIAHEVILSNHYDQKCDVFSFSIIMYQVLTDYLDNVYELNEIEEKKKNEEKKNKKIKKINENDKENLIELKENLIENYNENEIDNNKLDFLNLEYKVANNEDFRPIIPNSILKDKKYDQFLNIMKICWNSNPKNRFNFNEITIQLEEILVNLN